MEKVLQERRVDFSSSAQRLRTIRPNFYDDHDGSHWRGGDETGGRTDSAFELAAAGFVCTAPSTAVCHSCHAPLDLSDHRSRSHSPWAVHAWSREGWDCPFLKRCLR